ncbi:hypothetical protein N7486_005834 [Penicillium sp. IBT 16267x]|nr:hypothetical protein N7486_005834 [Penicillium sp. IBT 16267x]
MGTYAVYVYLNLNERHLKNTRAIEDTFDELKAERSNRYDAIRSTRAHLSRPRSPHVETVPMKPQAKRGEMERRKKKGSFACALK